MSLLLLEELEAGGWGVSHSRWAVGGGDKSRPVAVHELSPPDADGPGGSRGN